MAKRLSKTLWYGTGLDTYGKPLLPPVATNESDLNGLHRGELFMHLDKKEVTLWALSSNNEVVQIAGKQGEIDIDLSDYLLKSTWDKVWELRKDNNGVEYIYSKLPVVTRYGVTMYGDNDELNVSDIYEGLPIDNVTLYWDNGVLKAKGGEEGGGEADSIAWANVYGKPSWITDTKPKYSYSEIEGTPDLSVFVTGTALSNTLADYATLTYLTGELNKYVTIKDDQDIVGVKNFLNGIKISHMPIRKLQDDVIYIDANLVVRGGVTMYSTNEADIPTIKDEIGFAGYNGSVGLASFDSSQFVISANGTVSVKGGSTGLDTAQLKEYLDNNKYTTETWVKAQGYASASSLSSLQTKVNNFLEGSDTDTIINKWKELEAFLSGLSESDNLATILATKWTTDNNLINQWNTAYGWGDHSKVGYALKSYVDNTFVTIAGNEDVTGVHNFVNGLKIGGVKLSRTTDDIIYLEGNLVVRGGVTMYALDDATVDSIIESLPLASTSELGIAKFNPSNFIINEDGFVTIISGSGGLDTEGLEQYLTTNKYATQGWVEDKGYITSSALNGYATQSWVTNQKYITGITSAMVVSALGFTPYNSASFTKANIKSTLGISDWALASSKPSYNFSELSSKPTTLGGYGITDAKISNGVITLGSATITPLTTHQTIYNLTLQAGTFSAKTFDPNGSAQTVNIPTTTSHISEGNNLYFTNARAVSALTDTLKAYVTLSGTQTITGEKNFTGGLRVNNSPSIYYDATNKYWKLEGDLLVTGGVTMYGTDEGDLPSILDSLPIASTSSAGIASFDSTYFSVNANGKVTLISAPSMVSILGSLQDVSSSVSGTTNSDVVLFKSANTSTWTTKLLSEIGGGGSISRPLRWTGYDSGTWDGSTDGLIVIPTSLKNPNALTFTGAVVATYDGSSAVTINIPTAETGGTADKAFRIVEQAMTDSIDTLGGYTGLQLLYNVSNSVIGTVGKYDAVLHVAGASRGFQLRSVKDSTDFYVRNVKTNGFTDWNKILHAGNYSSYANSIGVKIFTYDTDSLLPDNADLDNIGVGYYTTRDNKTYTNAPHTNFGLLVVNANTSYKAQLLLPYDSRNLRVKYRSQYYNNGIKWRDWSEIAFTDSNVVSATKLQTARTIWGQSFDGTSDITAPPKVYKDTSSYISFYSANGYAYYGDIGFYNGYPSIWTQELTWKTLLHEGNYSSYALPLNGNAASATKLKTARTIWGQSFDGTGNVTGSIYFPNNEDIIFKDSNGTNRLTFSLGTSNVLSIGYGTCVAGYNTNIYGNQIRLLYGTSRNELIRIVDGKVGIGTTSPAYNLDVNGSFGSTSVQVGSIFLGNQNEINGTSTRLWLNYSGSAQLLLGNNGYPVIVGTYANQAADIQNRLNYAPFSVFGTIFGYRFGKKASGAAFMFDKPGSNYTGFGADGTTDTIYFGACNKDADWVSYSQIWKFGGSIITTGGITMYSDQRKKTILNHVELSLKQIANAPLIQHYYNSDQDKTTHVGSIAQYWAGLNDWFCKLDAEGFYTMEIQNCALASAISIARHLEKYESKTDKKIRMLKKRVQELEDKLERLEGGNYGC